MMESWSVCLFGETCAGKSTLGKNLSSLMGCPYISFGDLKRDQIARGTKIGLEIQKNIELECLFPPELGYEVINNAISNGLNIISGYPITADELKILSIHSTVIGIIVLHVEEQVLARRFGLRRECPVCHKPGVIGDSCHTHKIAMVQREDVDQKEFISRRELYLQTIVPFLASQVAQVPPRLILNASYMAKDDVAYQAEQWIRHLKPFGGGIL